MKEKLLCPKHPFPAFSARFTAKRDVKERAVYSRSAEESALRLLAQRDYSREEMRRKLTAKGFPPGEIEAALGELEAKKFLDDFRYAQRLAIALAREKFLGPQQISQKFFQKGIPADLAQAAMAIAEVTLPATERLQKVMRMKLKGRLLEEVTLAEKRKLANTLRRKGFSWEDIQEAFRELGGFTEE